MSLCVLGSTSVSPNTETMVYGWAMAYLHQTLLVLAQLALGGKPVGEVHGTSITEYVTPVSMSTLAHHISLLQILLNGNIGTSTSTGTTTNTTISTSDTRVLIALLELSLATLYTLLTTLEPAMLFQFSSSVLTTTSITVLNMLVSFLPRFVSHPSLALAALHCVGLLAETSTVRILMTVSANGSFVLQHALSVLCITHNFPMVISESGTSSESVVSLYPQLASVCVSKALAPHLALPMRTLKQSLGMS